MMFRVYPLNKTNISISDYNNYIASSKYSSIFQSFEWGEIKKLDNWDVIRLVVLENGQIVGVASCLKKTLPGIKRKIFYSPRGPIVDYESGKGESVFNTLIREITKIARKQSGIFIRISPDLLKDKFDNSFWVREGFTPAKKPIMHTVTFRIDLTQDEELIYDKFESRIKYDIRKCIRQNVTIDNEDTVENFNEFYRLLQETSKKAQFYIYPYELMRNIWDFFIPQKMCKLFLAKYEDDVISGALLLTFGNRCIYMWGGYSRIYPEVSPNQLLHWEIIKWSKSKGYRIYDFQGIPVNPSEDNPLWGIYLFKRGFGGETIELIGEYDLVLSKPLYKIWNFIEPHYSELKAKWSSR